MARLFKRRCLTNLFITILLLQVAFVFLWHLRQKVINFIKAAEQDEWQDVIKRYPPKPQGYAKVPQHGVMKLADQRHLGDFGQNLEKVMGLLIGDPFTLDPNEYLSVPERKPFDLHCDTCSVVSSAGRLLLQDAGKEIDNATCVIRMNTSPIQGYEKHVGERTTIRVASFKAIDFLRTQGSLLEGPGRPKNFIVWAPSNLLSFTDEGVGIGKTYGQLVNLAKKNGDIGVYALTERQLEFVEVLFQRETGYSRHASGSWISTGFFSIILAVNICDDIRIYGMVPPDHCKNDFVNDTVPFHYYKPEGYRECAMYRSQEGKRLGGHRYISEKDVFKKWKLTKRLQFLYPTWDDTD
ncbi:alpha-N-acetyl-neuraminyl-2,3-beta-galactosyl-1,3-N-acetyl-galactosaminide alpha-2,6-sialyltransferase-like [Ptychodera flava]|uniref:alpha-N-acetyl-neuraminyl-2,3-beta-galactosyl-1, 3-N-acetyl-galactosaminide alpha-2,6-sialyltransferase-like n=1 Tax=Ptychodera flava TaxID=63121 RepID=UPI00396A42DD